MKPSRLLLSVLLIACASAWAQSPAVRQTTEDVNDATVRGRPGLRPDAHLLFNGWGITPAGTPVPISDLALKLVIAPDKKTVVAVSGGFRNPGLTLLDISGRRITQFLPLAKAWNGVAFSKDGRRIFVSGGDSGKIHAFSYTDGKATEILAVTPNTNSIATFLAGIAVHPTTGKAY